MIMIFFNLLLNKGYFCLHKTTTKNWLKKNKQLELQNSY